MLKIVSLKQEIRISGLFSKRSTANEATVEYIYQKYLQIRFCIRFRRRNLRYGKFQTTKVPTIKTAISPMLP